jgi:hypothetical protein
MHLSITFKSNSTVVVYEIETIMGDSLFSWRGEEKRIDCLLIRVVVTFSIGLN